MMYLMDRFECSKSTIKRDIAALRTDGAPIFHKEGWGYKLDKHIRYEVPGLWFSPEELHALLMIQQLTMHLSGGVFDVQPIQDKIKTLLAKLAPNSEEIHRIRVFNTGSRSKSMPMFGVVSEALLGRKRIDILYDGRQRGKRTDRCVSPQRMVFYRGNWYLDVWCHRANGLRSLAIERIKEAHAKDIPCKVIADDILDQHFTRSFGIYSGEPAHMAVLHFTAQASRWVEDEEWFPDLEGEHLDNGKFELCVPYSNPTELILEICRYGADVEVIEPASLREKVSQTLQLALRQYD